MAVVFADVKVSRRIVVLERAFVPLRAMADDPRLALGKAWKSRSRLAAGLAVRPVRPTSGTLNSRPSMNCSAKWGRPVRATKSLSRSRTSEASPSRTTFSSSSPPRAMLPYRLDDAGRLQGAVGPSCREGLMRSESCSAKPRRRRQPGLPHGPLGDQLVVRRKEGLGVAAGVRKTQGVQQRGGQVRQRVAAAQRLDEVDHRPRD